MKFYFNEFMLIGPVFLVCCCTFVVVLLVLTKEEKKKYQPLFILRQSTKMVKMNRSTLKRRTTAAAARRAPKPIISKQSPRAKRCSENISQGSRNKEALQNSLKCCKRLVVRVRKLPMTIAKNDDVTAASQKRQEKDLSRGVMANEKEKENEGTTISKQTTINTAQDKQPSESVDTNNCLSNGKEVLATTKRSQRKLLRGGKSRSMESGECSRNHRILLPLLPFLSPLN